MVSKVGIHRLRRSFPWTFVIADVIQPIIGVDFLAKHCILVDCQKNHLIDALTNISVPLEKGNSLPPSLTFNVSHVDHRVLPLLNKYPSLLTTQNNSVYNPDVPIKHHIDTGTSRPISFKPRPLTGDKLTAAKADFQNLLDSGIIRRSNSPWATPLHLVPKKEPNTWRSCGDYRRLNNVTTDDKYPIPHLRTLTMSLHGKK